MTDKKRTITIKFTDPDEPVITVEQASIWIEGRWCAITAKGIRTVYPLDNLKYVSFPYEESTI